MPKLELESCVWNLSSLFSSLSGRISIDKLGELFLYDILNFLLKLCSWTLFFETLKIVKHGYRDPGISKIRLFVKCTTGFWNYQTDLFIMFFAYYRYFRRIQQRWKISKLWSELRNSINDIVKSRKIQIAKQNWRISVIHLFEIKPIKMTFSWEDRSLSVKSLGCCVCLASLSLVNSSSNSWTLVCFCSTIRIAFSRALLSPYNLL